MTPPPTPTDNAPPPPDSPARPLFTAHEIVWLPLLFVAAFFAANKLVHFARQFVGFDCPRYWPLSVFNSRWPAGEDLLTAALVAVAAVVLLRWLDRRGYPTGAVAAAGLLLILGTNLIQGPREGFVTPIAGGLRHGIQYYHDALTVTDTASFLRTFNERQPSLLEHGRTHPPGAVLVFHYLRLLTGDRPAAIAALIAVISALLSALFFRAWLASLWPESSSLHGWLTCAYLLLPAVQIYYAATLDALIAALLLGVAALYARRPATLAATAGAAVLLFLVSFLTFGVVWVLPVLLAMDVVSGPRRFRLPWRLAAVVAAVASGYLLLYAAFGFSYLSALLTASRLENPQGFRLLDAPASYLFTRIEDVAEILFFFGPFLLILFLRGISLMAKERPAAFIPTAAALTSLGLLFLTGAYRTGETARACLFLYPYLLLPVTAHLARLRPSARERLLLLYLLLAQTVAMQLLGRYFW